MEKPARKGLEIEPHNGIRRVAGPKPQSLNILRGSAEEAIEAMNFDEVIDKFDKIIGNLEQETRGDSGDTMDSHIKQKVEPYGKSSDENCRQAQLSMDIDEDIENCKAPNEEDRMTCSSELQICDVIHHERTSSRLDNTLIVTNIIPEIFNDGLLQTKLESLFKAYDTDVKFKYLKSFRRIRVDFSTAERAEAARLALDGYSFGGTSVKCSYAKIIKLTNEESLLSQSASDEDESIYYELHDNRKNNFCHVLENSFNRPQFLSRNFLSPPKPTKQFLISPPVSPPVEWTQVTEASPSPCALDAQLISAIANLVPGSVHELHQATESQPGIVVEVCEEPNFEGGDSITRGRVMARIPRTMRAQPQAT